MRGRRRGGRAGRGKVCAALGIAALGNATESTNESSAHAEVYGVTLFNNVVHACRGRCRRAGHRVVRDAESRRRRRAGHRAARTSRGQIYRAGHQDTRSYRRRCCRAGHRVDRRAGHRVIRQTSWAEISPWHRPETPNTPSRPARENKATLGFSGPGEDFSRSYPEYGSRSRIGCHFWRSDLFFRMHFADRL